MKNTKLMASLLIGAALTATTFATPAFASRQGDELTMMAAQMYAQQVAQAQAQAAYQAQIDQQNAYLQQLAAQNTYCAPAPPRFEHRWHGDHRR